LVKSGISTEAIHGDKSQNARQNALNNFKEKKPVLVATDIAARGDIDELKYVVNYEFLTFPKLMFTGLEEPEEQVRRHFFFVC
jgi:superfamily II DNA/RNA helicase